MSAHLPGLGRDGLLTPDRARAYAQARRHSWRVRTLKLAIPVGALVASALVVAATLYKPFGDIAGLSLGSLSFSGTKIAMENPKLTGFRKDSRPYEVTAKAAFQDVRKPALIELKDMNAKLTADSAGTVVNLISSAGLFDTSKEFLELTQDIRITTSKGDEVTLRSASIDMKNGTVVSREPVRITTPTGTIEAEGVEVSDSGRMISFQGRVRTQFSRAAIEAATPEPVAGARPQLLQAEAIR